MLNMYFLVVGEKGKSVHFCGVKIAARLMGSGKKHKKKVNIILYCTAY